MRYALLVIFVIAASLTACGGDSLPAPTTSVPVAGDWSLRTPLPYSQIGGLGLRTDYTGAALSIANNGLWTETLAVSVVTATGTFNQSVTRHGTYVILGASIHFSAYDDPEYMDCEITADALLCNQLNGFPVLTSANDGHSRYTR
jgi:hypothetical protein